MKNFIDITHKNLAVKLAETREEIEKARVLRFDELINKSCLLYTSDAADEG